MSVRVEQEDREIKRIEARFRRRTLEPGSDFFGSSRLHVLRERDDQMRRLLSSHFGALTDCTALEVGAGSGANISSLLKLGLKSDNCFANELVPERAKRLKEYIPPENVHVGDIRNFRPDFQFDIIFVATVFTSVLNVNLRLSMAEYIWSLTKSGGAVLWYDFKFEMPWNKETIGLPFKEVRELFPNGKSYSRRSVTLYSPIARRVGGFYRWINFPFLRSHELILIAKQ